MNLPQETLGFRRVSFSLPWADEPSPGNLGLSTCKFLAYISLLIPAFSLLYRPQVLTVLLQPVHYAPLPLTNHVNMISKPEAHPFPLNTHFGTLAVDLGCFPFDYGSYNSQSDST